jgi:hypothetical protein
MKMNRKCTVEAIIVRKSDQLGDFYFSWIARLYRVKSGADRITNYDLIISPNPDRNYSSKKKAYESGCRYVEEVLGFDVFELPAKTAEKLKNNGVLPNE